MCSKKEICQGCLQNVGQDQHIVIDIAYRLVWYNGQQQTFVLMWVTNQNNYPYPVDTSKAK